MTTVTYQRTLEQLLAEERHLRRLAEEQVQACNQVFSELATSLAPAEMDARRRTEPAFPRGMSAEAWRSFFQELDLRHRPRTDRAPGWNGAEQLVADRQEVRRLQAEMADLQARLAAEQAENSRLQATAAGQLAEKAHASKEHDNKHVELPPPVALPVPSLSLPPRPPAQFAHHFQNWPREGWVVLLLATTGWSLRWAMDEALAHHLGISPGSGSIKRLFQRLEKVGLCRNQVVDLGSTRTAIITLADQGRAVAQAVDVEPVPGEWEVLMAAHGGERQAKHAALVCIFTYHARQRGYTVQVCPDLPRSVDDQGQAINAQPDVRIERGEERIYVEVEAESGDAERRMVKWRNQARLQGFVALCAPTPEARSRLVAEARGAAKKGRASDVRSLMEQQELWSETW